MSHRLRLLLVTCALCLSISPAHAAANKPTPAPRNWTGLIMTLVVVTSAVGGAAYSLGYGRGRSKAVAIDPQPQSQPQLPTTQRVLPEIVAASQVIDLDRKSDELSKPDSEASKPETSEASRLAKVDIVEELIHDLQSLDSVKRRKAIWELGQQGDSRAVQPMVDLLIDSDSQQRSLILAAVSEIGIKTLKPVNRALMLSLQDSSADVRKNGIRDVTRIYDLVGQITQLLQHAASDPDEEVQETASWALSQINRIRPAGIEGVPKLPNGLSFKELEAVGEVSDS